MKRYDILLLFSCFILLASCQVSSPPEPTPEPPPVIVSIGDSITMGIQDAGLVSDYQRSSYPYLIAKQMGAQFAFRQPYVSSPGIGVPPYERPLEISGNQIIATEWPKDEDGNPIIDEDAVIKRLQNLFYRTPYNNLGVNGSRLYEMRYTTTAEESVTGDNFFFDIVLRNITPPPLPNFGGTTVVEQAAMLQPDIILLWIGNNDILHTVLNGCGTNGSGFTGDDPPTDPEEFETEFDNLLNDLKAITDDIIMATIPNYLPFGFALDGIFVADDQFQTGRLMVFDTETFEPILFDCDSYGNRYIPLLLEEEDAEHLSLIGAIAFLEEGAGIPNQIDLEGMGIVEPGLAASMVAAMSGEGITIPDPTASLPGTFTVTADEQETVFTIIDQYNAVLSSLTETYGLHLVDITGSWWRDYDLDPEHPAFGGYSGAFVLQDKDNTTFSLDGVHVNDLGHTLCANAFIEVLNDHDGLDLGITPLDPNDYKGQYSGKSVQGSSLKALKRVLEMYVPENR
jgi:lysophospholipase L1-like esterase